MEMKAKIMFSLLLALLLVLPNAIALDLNPEVKQISLYNSTALITKEESINTIDPEIKVYIPLQADNESLLVIDSGAELIQVSIGEEDKDELMKSVELQLLQANIGNNVSLSTESFGVEGTLDKILQEKIAVISQPEITYGELTTEQTSNFFLPINKITSMSLQITPEILGSDELEKALNQKYVLVKENILNSQRDLKLKYFVNNSGWNPSYQLFLNEEGDNAELRYFANAHNGTDEDWDNASLQIISGNPVTKSFFTPRRSYDYETYKAVPLAVSEEAGAVMDGQFNSAEAGDLHVYSLQRTVDIPKQSSAMIPILEDEVPIEKEYKWNANYYSDVESHITIVNSSDEPLASGWVSVYSDEDYIGGNNLPWTQTDANNSIKVGTAVDIEAEKTLETDTGRMPESTTTNYNGELYLKNHKSEAVEVTVTDYLPSDAENVQSNFPYEEKEGNFEWKITLNPDEEKTITYSYKTTYFLR